MELLLNTIMLEPNRWSSTHELSWPLVDLLEPIQVAGFDALELWGYHVDRLDDAGVEDLAATLCRRGQRAVAVGAYPAFHLEGTADAAEIEGLERVAAVSARLGATVFKIFPGRVGSADADDALWKRSLERLRRLAGRLADDGMLLTLETHGRTLCDTLDSTARVLDALAATGNVGICFQPYAEQDTDQAIAAYDSLRGHIRHVHLQNRGGGDARTVTRLEEGEWTDYRRFLPHVRDSGFDGPLCLEFTAGITPPEGHPFDLTEVLGNAMRDRRFVQDIWAG